MSVTTTEAVFICPWIKIRRIRGRYTRSARLLQFPKSAVYITGTNGAQPEGDLLFGLCCIRSSRVCRPVVRKNCVRYAKSRCGSDFVESMDVGSHARVFGSFDFSS